MDAAPNLHCGAPAIPAAGGKFPVLLITAAGTIAGQKRMRAWRLKNRPAAHLAGRGIRGAMTTAESGWTMDAGLISAWNMNLRGRPRRGIQLCGALPMMAGCTTARQTRGDMGT